MNSCSAGGVVGWNAWRRPASRGMPGILSHPVEGPQDGRRGLCWRASGLARWGCGDDFFFRFRRRPALTCGCGGLDSRGEPGGPVRGPRRAHGCFLEPGWGASSQRCSGASLGWGGSQPMPGCPLGCSLPSRPWGSMGSSRSPPRPLGGRRPANVCPWGARLRSPQIGTFQRSACG